MPALFDKMVCLVGENPLPVYLGIKQLATPEAEVVLVYSKATKPQAKNIKALLDKAKRRLPFLITDDSGRRWLDKPATPVKWDTHQGSLLEARFHFIL